MGSIPFYVVIRSKLPCTFIESMISKVVTHEVHTEYMLLNDNPNQVVMTYTAFVNNKVSMDVTLERSVLSEDFKNVLIEVSPVEMENICAFFSKMVGRVKYNWFDSRILLPLFRPRRDNVFVEDVEEGIEPDKISQVFCSQMGVLALRACLDARGENGALHDELHCLNSRLTSPHALYSTVKHHGMQVDGRELLALIRERQTM